MTVYFTVQLYKFLVKQCLSNIDIDKSAKGMLEVVKAELSQGQAHIGIRGIENALADSVLSGLYNRFIDKIDVSAGEVSVILYFLHLYLISFR